MHLAGLFLISGCWYTNTHFMALEIPTILYLRSIVQYTGLLMSC
jgi:hypothetical protein